MTIAICDVGGHLLALRRLDGAAPLTSHIAPAKAKTSAVARRESKVDEDVINNGRTAFVTAPFMEGMLAGAVPIILDRQMVGASPGQRSMP